MQQVLEHDAVAAGRLVGTELLRDLTPDTIDALLDVAGPHSRSPLVMVEVRQLGGALAGPPGALSPMAHTNARFSLNAIGVTATPAAADPVRTHLARLQELMARGMR